VSHRARKACRVPDIRLERPGDPRVAEYRDVPEPELIRARGLFVAEGRLVVRRLIDERRYRVRSLLLNKAARRELEPWVARLDPDVPVYVCAADHFLDVTGLDIHRGCLALVERPPASPLDNVLRDARLAVALEDVTNADNVGGVFRNVAAFGADAVLLSPSCCDPLYRKAIRTSMAATLRVPFARIDAWPDGLLDLRARGFTLVALTPREPALALDGFARTARPDRLVLLVGTEGAGLSPAIERAADVRVRIPVRAAVDSLNLAVATGIALTRLTGAV
jgi:tRNA G18 (ribose-2'-O)-methylase SpoU